MAHTRAIQCRSLWRLLFRKLFTLSYVEKSSHVVPLAAQVQQMHKINCFKTRRDASERLELTEFHWSHDKCWAATLHRSIAAARNRQIDTGKFRREKKRTMLKQSSIIVSQFYICICLTYPWYIHLAQSIVSLFSIQYWISTGNFMHNSFTHLDSLFALITYHIRRAATHLYPRTHTNEYIRKR